MPAIYTTRQVGDLLGLPEWKIRRLFELGILDEPRRLAGKRVIDQAMLPSIVDALRSRGWLSSEHSAEPALANT